MPFKLRQSIAIQITTNTLMRNNAIVFGLLLAAAVRAEVPTVDAAVKTDKPVVATNVAPTVATDFKVDKPVVMPTFVPPKAGTTDEWEGALKGKDIKIATQPVGPKAEVKPMGVAVQPQVGQDLRRPTVAQIRQIPPGVFFPTLEELKANVARQRLRDETQIKLVTYITGLFKTPMASTTDMEAQAPKLMSDVENFILENLTSE